MEEYENTYERQGLCLDYESKQHLFSIQKVLKIFAIISIVGLALIFISAIFCLFGASYLTDINLSDFSYNYYNEAFWGVIGFFMLIIVGIAVIPVVYMLKSCSAIKKLLLSNNPIDFETYTENTKSLFKFYGILSITVLSLFVIALIATILGTLIIH